MTRVLGRSQTEEGRNADPADNRDHYVLEDLMGGHNVLAVDHDGDSATDRMVSYQTFDAFGNVQKKWLPHTATFAWRGSEGSKTDTAANLVEMGARTYDPTLGRFLQADALPMASGTSQGMNRYIYCESDPVNASDPSGHIMGAAFLLLAAITVAVGFYSGSGGGGGVLNVIFAAVVGFVAGVAAEGAVSLAFPAASPLVLAIAALALLAGGFLFGYALGWLFKEVFSLATGVARGCALPMFLAWAGLPLLLNAAAMHSLSVNGAIADIEGNWGRG